MTTFSSFEHELPPVRNYTFLGTENSDERPIITADDGGRQPGRLMPTKEARAKHAGKAAAP